MSTNRQRRCRRSAYGTKAGRPCRRQAQFPSSSPRFGFLGVGCMPAKCLRFDHHGITLDDGARRENCCVHAAQITVFVMDS